MKVLTNEVAAEYGIDGKQATDERATREEGINFPTWLLIITYCRCCLS